MFSKINLFNIFFFEKKNMWKQDSITNTEWIFASEMRSLTGNAKREEEEGKSANYIYESRKSFSFLHILVKKKEFHIFISRSC